VLIVPVSNRRSRPSDGSCRSRRVASTRSTCLVRHQRDVTVAQQRPGAAEHPVRSGADLLHRFAPMRGITPSRHRRHPSR
jgi:hypothetical protein